MPVFKVTIVDYVSKPVALGRVTAASEEVALKLARERWGEGLSPHEELRATPAKATCDHVCTCGWTWKAPASWRADGKLPEKPVESLCTVCSQERVVEMRAQAFLTQRAKLEKLKTARAAESARRQERAKAAERHEASRRPTAAELRAARLATPKEDK